MALQHRFAPSAVALSLLALGACTAVTDFGRFRGGGAEADASVDAPGDRPDGGPRPDTGVPSECMPECDVDETCCGDTCADLSLDPENCGDCGTVCPDRDHSSPACDELGCDYDCDPGYDDCDGLETNGCEQPLNTPDNCGSCDHACDAATPMCNGDLGTCVSACSDTEMSCGGTCVNVMGSDVTHCGSCDPCADLPNAAASCVRGTCSYTCTGAFMDCNGDLGARVSDGCERVPTTYYVDGDRDGYGNAGDVMACEPPPGTSVMGGDCDDGNGLVYPGAAETCNGVDDDCDRTADDGLSYMGTAVGGSCSCRPASAPGVVACGAGGTAECSYPSEVCNGVDDDCDGSNDDGFSCVRGAMSACTGTGVGSCTFVGSQSCDATCTMGSCTPPGELCDRVDQNCDGFLDEGTLIVTPPRGGFADGLGGARFVAAAWRDAANGGAALISVEDPITFRRELRFHFIDNVGALTGGFSHYLLDVGDASSGRGVNVPAALGWDGGRWVVFYMYFDPVTGGEIRRRTITPEPGGAMSTPTVEAMGMSSVAVARGSTGDLGVVFGRFDEVRTGVWRAGGWARVPVASIAGRTALDYAQVAPTAGGSFMALTAETSGAGRGLLLQPYTATVSGSVFGAIPGSVVDGRLAYEPTTDRLILTWRAMGSGEPFVARWNTGGGTLDGPVTSLGVGNTPRVATTGGEIFLAPGPDIRRMRPDGALYTESIAPTLYVDVLIGTPGAPQAALAFSYDGTINGPATRRVRCPGL